MITLTDYDGFSASYNDANFITVTPYTQNGVAGSKIEYLTNTYTIEVAYVTSTPSTISGSSIYVQPLTIVLNNGQTEVFYLNPLFYKSYTAVGSNTQLIYEYDQASQPQSYITSTSTSTINAQIAAVMGGGGSGWSLTGNAGTNPSTDFVGTTDAQDLVIKTDNTERIRVLGTGNVGIGTATPVATLDVLGRSKAEAVTLIGINYYDTNYSGGGLFRIGVIDTGTSQDTNISLDNGKIDIVSASAFTSSISLLNGGIEIAGYSNYKISVGGDPSNTTSSGLEVFSPDTTTIPAFVVYGDSLATKYSIIHALSNGLVGIGTSTPTETLDVAGTAKADTLTLTTVPAFDDDAAAGTGGLLTGQIYQTTGSGAAPLNVAGILMIKQ